MVEVIATDGEGIVATEDKQTNPAASAMPVAKGRARP